MSFVSGDYTDTRTHNNVTFFFCLRHASQPFAVGTPAIASTVHYYLARMEWSKFSGIVFWDWRWRWNDDVSTPVPSQLGWWICETWLINSNETPKLHHDLSPQFVIQHYKNAYSHTYLFHVSLSKCPFNIIWSDSFVSSLPLTSPIKRLKPSRRRNKVRHQQPCHLILLPPDALSCQDSNFVQRQIKWSPSFKHCPRLNPIQWHTVEHQS